MTDQPDALLPKWIVDAVSRHVQAECPFSDEALSLDDIENIVSVALAHYLVLRPTPPSALELARPDFTAVLATVTHGYGVWATKPHNARWIKLIEGTPIPNDLSVCIAEEVARALLAGRPQESAGATGGNLKEVAAAENERLRSRLAEAEELLANERAAHQVACTQRDEAEAAYVEVRLALEKLVSATPGTNFRMHFKRAVETLQSTTLGADVSAVIEAAREVHANFVKSEAQGFRSRDRQYAIDLLGPVLAKLGKKT